LDGAEVFLYDLGSGTTTRLTNNTYEDSYPRVSGTNVVWNARDYDATFYDWEVFLYDGSTTKQLTNNIMDDWLPWVSGSTVVWEGGLSEIFLYDGSTTTRLTNNLRLDHDVNVSGSNVVWVNSNLGGTDYRVFLYDGSTTTQLADNVSWNTWPVVSGSHAVWIASEEVYLARCIDTATLTLTRWPPTWGSVAKAPEPLRTVGQNRHKYEAGTEVILTAEPNDPRGFKHWIIYDPNVPGLDANAVIDANLTTTITMDTDRRVKAVFRCGNNAGPLLPMMVGVLGLFAVVRRYA
jgi:hypothetical protein